MSSKKDFFYAVAVTALTLFIVFCMLTNFGIFQMDTPTASVDETEDLITVGFSQIGSESVWRTANTNSIQSELSKENGFFLRFKNARQKQDNQIKTIREYISQRVDYIIFAPCTEDGWDTVLKEAKDARIPVIIVDRMVDVEDDGLYTAFIGTDKEEEGRKAGKWLEDYLRERDAHDEDINIVILKGTEGSTAEIGRTAGFDEIAAKHPNWHVLAAEDADFTTTKGREVMASFLRLYDHIDVVVSQNDDMTFGAIEAMDKAGVTYGIDGDVTLISFDATKNALKMVEEGIINVDVECTPEQGDDIAELIRRLEAGESVDKINNIDEMVFTKENVESYIDSRPY